MDQLLLPYLQASDESERERHLDELLVVYATPVVRHILRLKLGFRVNQLGVNPYNQDAEDLYQEIIVKIVEFLRTAPATAKTRIENFKQYAARVATNACHDYVRAKSPERTRLKYSLRELFSRRSEFALWKSNDGFLCGLAAWGNESEPISSRRLAEIEDELEIFRTTRFGREDIRQVPLAKVVADFLQWARGSMDLEALVTITAVLLDVSDHPVESLDDEAKGYLEAGVADTTLMRDPLYDFEKVLLGLWQAVTSLPDKQRDTFFLSFEDDHGEDLFTLLFEADIFTPSQLAKELKRPLEDVVRVWSEMPMDDAAIAEELGGTRSQIRKWRFDALRRLEKEFEPFLTQK
jgi:RNA polymerase sigma factor (sigma-70 family)